MLDDSGVAMYCVGYTPNGKQLIAGGKLDADSKSVAADILDSTICKNLAAAQAQAQQQQQ